MTTVYTADFYGEARAGVETSAQIVVPKLLALFPVTSVVDVGCGEGTWLKWFQQHGASRVVGVDGSYVADGSYRLDPATFVARDLSQPIGPLGTFDLATCLEVAEHLDATRADSLIADLCSLADIVLFGAAIPGQGGQHHINEQWPSYWARKFQARGYLPYDVLRHDIWACKQVTWWYRQNTVLYVREHSASAAHFAGHRAADIDALFDIVHPELFEPAIRSGARIQSLMRRLGVQKIRQWLRA
jgi:SAM-dependent methyltransferase